jgi:hypothetical protein
MEKQMELFEDGGLKDEGGMVDEQSGNDVPVGSSRKEVRDDIPAMLSEGEFVFPADVVRYHGLDKLMDLRQQAKMGLKQMEAMGQMGNSEDATMPDDMPFGPSDLIIVGGEMKDGPQEMAKGGVVYANQGTLATGISGYQPSIYQGQQTSSTYTPSASSVAPPTPAASPAGGYMPKFMANQITPVYSDTTTDTTENEFLPTLEDVYTSLTYINKETNEKRDFFFYNDEPVTPIPDGFVPYDESVDETVSDLESTTVETTQVTSGSDDPPPMETPEPVDYGKMKDAELKKAYSQNQTATAIMAGLTAVNPIFGLFGSWATRSTGNTIAEEMKKRGIKVPESTGIKGVFGNIIDGIKDMLGLDDDQTTAVKNAVTNQPIENKVSSQVKAALEASTAERTSSQIQSSMPGILSMGSDEDKGRTAPTAAQTAAATSGVATTGRVDSSGKTAGDTGYVSALAQRQSQKDNSPPKTTTNVSNSSSVNKAANTAASKAVSSQQAAGKTESIEQKATRGGGFKQGGLATRKKKK